MNHEKVEVDKHVCITRVLKRGPEIQWLTQTRDLEVERLKNQTEPYSKVS